MSKEQELAGAAQPFDPNRTEAPCLKPAPATEGCKCVEQGYPDEWCKVHGLNQAPATTVPLSGRQAAGEQEWTVKEHPVGWIIASGNTEIARFVKQLCPESEIQKLLDAHNAAIAAERETAESLLAEVNTLGGDLQQLREQLDAEREKAGKVIASYVAIADERERQLAKMGEQYKAEIHSRIDLEQQLAAEHEIQQKLNRQLDDAEDELATSAKSGQAAVEALTAVKVDHISKRTELTPLTFAVVCNVLAKITVPLSGRQVKEGK